MDELIIMCSCKCLLYAQYYKCTSSTPTLRPTCVYTGPYIGPWYIPRIIPDNVGLGQTGALYSCSLSDQRCCITVQHKSKARMNAFFQSKASSTIAIVISFHVHHTFMQSKMSVQHSCTCINILHDFTPALLNMLNAFLLFFMFIIQLVGYTQ